MSRWVEALSVDENERPIGEWSTFDREVYLARLAISQWWSEHADNIFRHGLVLCGGVAVVYGVAALVNMAKLV